MPPPPVIKSIDFKELLNKANDRKHRALNKILHDLRFQNSAICKIHLDMDDKTELQARAGDILKFENRPDGSIDISITNDLPFVTVFQKKYVTLRNKRLDTLLKTIVTKDLPVIKKSLSKWLNASEDIQYNEDCKITHTNEFVEEIRNVVNSHVLAWLEQKGYKVERLIVNMTRIYVKLCLLSENEVERMTSAIDKGTFAVSFPKVQQEGTQEGSENRRQEENGSMLILDEPHDNGEGSSQNANAYPPRSMESMNSEPTGTTPRYWFWK